MTKVIPIQKARECGSCNTCCEGWLLGSAHGHGFWPGRACFYKNDQGCSIYEDRPKDPCIDYSCKWLIDTTLPEWMRPDLCKAIVSNKTYKGVDYVEITEAGRKLDSEVLSWFYMQHATGKIPNIRYQINSGWNFIGTKEFVAAMQNQS